MTHDHLTRTLCHPVGSSSFRYDVTSSCPLRSGWQEEGRNEDGMRRQERVLTASQHRASRAEDMRIERQRTAQQVSSRLAFLGQPRLWQIACSQEPAPWLRLFPDRHACVQVRWQGIKGQQSCHKEHRLPSSAPLHQQPLIEHSITLNTRDRLKRKVEVRGVLMHTGDLHLLPEPLFLLLSALPLKERNPRPGISYRRFLFPLIFFLSCLMRLFLSHRLLEEPSSSGWLSSTFVS